jgi:cAMP phosphodiesterase
MRSTEVGDRPAPAEKRPTEMKFQMLPSSFDDDGSPSLRQHLSCLIVDDKVAIDAGSLAMAATTFHRENLRNVVLTHAHLDHIAGLPLFIDDVFASLTEPINIYAMQEVLAVLERDVFNWSVYPNFSEIGTDAGTAIVYHPVKQSERFQIGDLEFELFPADHKVPSSGVTVSDGKSSVAITGDTASLCGVGVTDGLSALLIECAFPDELAKIAADSRHMTPSILAGELQKLKPECPVFVINIKANYRDKVVRQLEARHIPGLEIMQVGKNYFW